INDECPRYWELDDCQSSESSGTLPWSLEEAVVRMFIRLSSLLALVAIALAWSIASPGAPEEIVSDPDERYLRDLKIPVFCAAVPLGRPPSYQPLDPGLEFLWKAGIATDDADLL